MSELDDVRELVEAVTELTFAHRNNWDDYMDDVRAALAKVRGEA
jgi:hypothetical protein